MARFGSGTVCARLAFMRAAGTDQTGQGQAGLTSKLISSQHALRISPDRAAVRIRNSSASFVVFPAFELFIAAMHLATSSSAGPCDVFAPYPVLARLL